MLAAVLHAHDDLRVAPVATPEPVRDTDVLLDIALGAVCGTDLHAIHDPSAFGVPAGTVLGHEFVGVVRAVGPSVANVAVGQRVVVAPNLACGWCDHCRLGLANHCRNRRSYGFTDHGGFAPHAVVDALACHPIAGHVSDADAVLAEPLSTVLASLRQAEPFPGETAVVIGAGPIGLMHCVMLAAAGMAVIVVEPSPPRAAAAAALGFEVAGADHEAVRASVRRAVGELGVDVVIDTAGTQLALAAQLVRPAGRIVLFGVAPGFVAPVPLGLLQVREARVSGCLIGQSTFAPAVTILEQGRIDFRALHAEETELDGLVAAIDRQRRHEALKVAVRFPVPSNA